MPLQGWAMSDFMWPDAKHRPDHGVEIEGSDS